jgi:allantoinase
MSQPELNIVRPLTAAEPGYDHGWFPYTPLPARPDRRQLAQPGLALSVVVDVRAAEWEDSAPAVGVPGGRGQAPYPDFPRMSHREFGHRAGLFRLAAILREAAVPWAAAVDVLTAEHYPRVLSLLQDEAVEILAGGLSSSRAISSLMSEPEEDHYIGQTLDRLESAIGTRPRGWMSPQGSQSFRTPSILARHGVDYVADWANDEQPYAVTGAGDLWSLPVSWELSDLSSMFVRGIAPSSYARAVLEAVDVLAADSVRSPRMLCLHLHPWLSGEPFRARAVRDLMAQLASRTDVWWASPADIVDHGRSGQR